MPRSAAHQDPDTKRKYYDIFSKPGNQVCGMVQDYVIAASNYILNVGLNHNQLWDKLPLYFKNNRPFLDK